MKYVTYTYYICRNNITGTGTGYIFWSKIFFMIAVNGTEEPSLEIFSIDIVPAFTDVKNPGKDVGQLDTNVGQPGTNVGQPGTDDVGKPIIHDAGQPCTDISPPIDVGQSFTSKDQDIQGCSISIFKSFFVLLYQLKNGLKI